jgi:hypothetical protein
MSKAPKSRSELRQSPLAFRHGFEIGLKTCDDLRSIAESIVGNGYASLVHLWSMPLDGCIGDHQTFQFCSIVESAIDEEAAATRLGVQDAIQPQAAPTDTRLAGRGEIALPRKPG